MNHGHCRLTVASPLSVQLSGIRCHILAIILLASLRSVIYYLRIRRTVQHDYYTFIYCATPCTIDYCINRRVILRLAKINILGLPYIKYSTSRSFPLFFSLGVVCSLIFSFCQPDDTSSHNSARCSHRAHAYSQYCR